MVKFTAKITDPVGLHARPAGIMSTEASKFKADMTIISEGRKGNIKSIMNLMSLAIKSGTEITIETNGPDEEQALAGMREVMIANGIITK
ncbi:HPr family phosphocarrier protein [Williamsoniiplasma lucivorax]|uniref:Phosphocarrier protein HPr n=1 Tax=Williamsoniiplasma lucivorax TaxID=209274 RepID=A0A2S5RA08_9MOLU|nr:HPr family phosphocarrier protein [Williamsoniiplasma lucivorax]PPE04164.1 phosphocarrier protein HPr [Williamsoniiplasma lucivorax]